jgi:hypothetical protein
VSTTALLLQNIALLPLLRAVLGLAACAAVLMFFKPLLSGIVRALVLVVRPRLSKEELAARRHMRDAQMLQKMINSSDGPSHAAELRAMASRA